MSLPGAGIYTVYPYAGLECAALIIMKNKAIDFLRFLIECCVRPGLRLGRAAGQPRHLHGGAALQGAVRGELQGCGTAAFCL